MLVPRLGQISKCLCRINRPTYLVLQRGAKELTQELEKKRDNDHDDEKDDKPIPLSTSEAAKWKARYIRDPPRGPQVWYTAHVVWASIIVFMVYFCILREENDIDDIMYRPLTETIEGLEEVYPNIDFSAKPDFVLYHEKMNELKKKRKMESEQKGGLLDGLWS